MELRDCWNVQTSGNSNTAASSQVHREFPETADLNIRIECNSVSTPYAHKNSVSSSLHVVLLCISGTPYIHGGIHDVPKHCEYVSSFPPVRTDINGVIMTYYRYNSSASWSSRTCCFERTNRVQFCEHTNAWSRFNILGSYCGLKKEDRISFQLPEYR